ncbi:Putative pyridoxal phosphate-dependent decarboxylase, pyridoxal phosphate-dependent transferase [Septoria linicola]|uniref:Pyridoxal phosphate-dependent decarboxylase, pyridoxal phosphate-dependent transferase n=1 Tax=Septoria linicola TaxID=215465 RepID=A0A9Q9B7M9_9PEZI|nr:putative pyridoxal phosphate-dependent decarboxylase, pyridoxal phosphate-dependent transferase [Septoria linicola]USW58903.1 Putative pyridoxal phosphate-dependent decarboxylase, pyridoxal phosphate-dependent transferase [Septoria linicola]
MSSGQVLPDPATTASSRTQLVRILPAQGLGTAQAVKHVQQVVEPALNQSSQSPNYYGFVTGGSTRAASLADELVTRYDQNVAVHLPGEAITTDVEDAALLQLLDLVKLPQDEWKHRIFTTGATASNVLGLASGREWVISEAAKRQGTTANISEDGIHEAMKKADIDSIQILTTLPHSSLGKAASIVGLGRNSVKSLGLYQSPWNFAVDALEEALATPRTASIIAISAGEVNTGFFATTAGDLVKIRELADKYHAWIHVDAAFGLQSRLLPTDKNEYAVLTQGVADLELADSITGDAHKLLNVPYDCGIFFSRHLDIGTSVFQNAGAAYFSSSATDMPSPSSVGIENSRRFRALPVYSTLLAHGRDGYLSILEKQIALARGIATFIQSEPALELLPRFPPSFRRVKEGWLNRIYIIVLFRAANDTENETLVQKINATRRIYVSGTVWDGRPAARFAVSNWQVDVERDLRLIKEVLWQVLD